MDFLIGFIFVLGFTGFALFITDMVVAIYKDVRGR
jgi:hypothetical protein